jgi:uncharacterized protein (UPF0332 family)
LDDEEVKLLLNNAHESLNAAELLLEQGFYRDAIKPDVDEAEEVVEDARRFIERIEKALEEHS